jgi:hypothetical protein
MPPIPVDQVSDYVRKLLSARKVADRYSIHIRSISRWIARGVIPPPSEIIASRRYWYSDVLDEADRKRTCEAGQATKAHHTSSP